jgi:hypothetical protein
MVLRAPVGTAEEVVLWLKGLQGRGCATVAQAVEARVEDPSGLGRPAPEQAADLGRPEGGGALIDPRRVNVFLGEMPVAGDEVADEMGEEGLGV